MKKQIIKNQRNVCEKNRLLYSDFDAQYKKYVKEARSIKGNKNKGYWYDDFKYFAHLVKNPNAETKNYEIEFISFKFKNNKELFKYYKLHKIQLNGIFPTIVQKKFKRIVIDLPMNNGFNEETIKSYFDASGIIVNRLVEKLTKRHLRGGYYYTSKCELLIPEEIKMSDIELPKITKK
jgi:hypothetical protein